MCIKVKHRTQKAALDAILRQYKEKPDLFVNLYCYKCPHCRFWHLTKRRERY